MSAFEAFEMTRHDDAVNVQEKAALAEKKSNLFIQADEFNKSKTILEFEMHH